jgi:hypothetical protein
MADAPLKPEADRLAQWSPDRDAADEQEREGYGLNDEQSSEEPDVLLDVPVLKVDEIDLEVDDLRAQLSLHAAVLDLLKLHVGADVTLGRVALKIKGVEAQALLKVRLDNVAAIINRVLTTIDRNPQVLEQVTRGLGTAVEQVGRGAGDAVGEVGRGAGEAAEQIGRGAGEAVGEVGRGAGEAVGEVGRGAGEAAEQVSRGAGEAVGEVGRGAGETVEAIGDAGPDLAEGVGRRTRSAVEDADATAEAPRRLGREARGGERQAARRVPRRVPRNDQAEESPPQRSRRGQPQRSRPDERRRGKPDESP